MKTILTITFLLIIDNYIFSQVKFDYLKLENNQFLFERVYDYDSLSADEIEKLLISNVPTLSNIKDFQNNQKIITAKIEGTKIDFKKYGGQSMSVPAFFGGLFFANISIVWKDKKYRVTATNMYFQVQGLGKMTTTDIFTKDRGTEMRIHRKLEESGIYLQTYLSELFTLKLAKKDW